MKGRCTQTDISGQAFYHMHLFFRKQRHFVTADQRVCIDRIGLLRFDRIFV